MSDGTTSTPDERYISPDERTIIRETLPGGWDGPLDMERDLLDHAEFMDAELERVTQERDALLAKNDWLERLLAGHEAAHSAWVVPAALLNPKDGGSREA